MVKIARQDVTHVGEKLRQDNCKQQQSAEKLI